MQAFLCHADVDKAIVEPVGSWLSKKGINVWLDKWRMTAGDSLVEKIGEGIAASDRLVVFLSPAAVTSGWVKKEIANGVVMEIAEARGLGSKFVIPTLLRKCEIPFLLRDKLYANFSDKTFDAACEELFRGITDTPLGSQQVKFENRIVRTHRVSPKTKRHALLIEFGVKASPTAGLHVGVKLSTAYSNVEEWFGPADDSTLRGAGGMYTESSTRREPPIYARKFATPGVTSALSFYVYFEADQAMDVIEMQYLDAFDREP